VIIERYLYREAGTAFAGVLSVLVLVWVSHRFVRYLAQAAAGNLSGDLILELLGLKLAANLALLLPISLYLALLLAVGRLYRDSEVTAMAAAGVGPGRLLRGSLRFSLGFATLAAAVALYLSPAAARLSDQLETQAEESADYSNILAGRFKALSDGDRVFYAEGVGEDGRSLQGVFAQVRDGERLHLVAAESGYQMREPRTGDRFLVLVDGHRYQGQPGSVDFLVTGFREHAIRIDEGRREARSRRIQGIPTGELLGSADPAHRAELHWRLAAPVSSVVLGAFGFLMARTSPRQGRYGGLFNAVLLYFVYANLLGAGRELIEQDRLPAQVGLWPVHLALGLSAAVVYFASSAQARRLVARLAGGRPGAGKAR
jgi:lipopolysaccharide export system permease protein